MAQEVGAAYVTLLPSTKGFSRNVEKELGSGFDNAEKRGSGVFKSMFGKVAGFAATAAVAVGGYFSAKKIFGGGLDRLLNIEDAQAKLNGLGHDAESVATIMTSALDSVRGTAYGLDTAATVAASAVAAGIQPGQELTRYLKLTADAATIAGSSMDEMGGIINQVTSKGYAGMENLNRLTERGVPIMQWLADEYGVTADELSKMVSRGEVDAETFRSAIENNIGGAALASGETTRGALANLGASLSRVGAGLLGGVFPMFRESIVGITGLLEPVETGAKAVGEAFGSWMSGTAIPAVQSVGAALSGMWETLSPILSGVGTQFAAAFSAIGPGVIEGLAPIGDAFLGLVQQIAPVLPEILSLVTAFNPLSLILKALLPIMPQLAGAVGQLVSALVGALGPILAALVPVLTEVAGILIGGLSQAFSALLPVIVGLLPTITQLINIVGGVLLTVIQALAPLLTMVAGVFATLLPVVMQLIPPILGIVEALLPIVGIIGELIGTLLPPLVDLFMALLEPILGLIAPLVEALAPILTTIGEVIGAVLVPVIQFLANILGALVKAVVPVVTVIAGALVDALTVAIKWITNAGKGVATFVTNGIARLREFVTGVGEKIGEAIQWFKDLPKKIGETLSNAKTWLVDTGKKIIQGLIDGIKGAFDGVKETLGNLTSKLTDWKGPPSRDATLLSGAGRLIIGGLVDGMESRYGDVRRSLEGLTDDIAGTAFSPMAAAFAGASGALAPAVAGAAAGGGPTVIVNPRPEMSESQIGDSVARTLERRMAGQGW